MRRRLTAAVLGVVAIVFMGAAPAPVGAASEGFTWYSDGTFMRTGPSGVAVTVFAEKARVNKPFLLVAASNEAGGRCQDNRVVLNPNVRRSSARGFIPYTSARLDLPPGEWQICFHEVPLDGFGSATLAVFYTVVAG